MTEAKIKIAHPRDWVELTPEFLQIMSFIGERGARARIRALEYINRDLPEERLRAALVASDNTIIKMLKRPDFQGRAVCSALNPAEAVWIAPPFEEGQRVCICRASLDEWYSTRPATPAAAADRQLRVAGESEPSPSPQAEQQPPPAAPDGDVSASVTNATSPPAEASPPRAREADATPIPTEGTSTAAKGKQRKKEVQEEIAEAAKKLWSPDGIVPLDLGPANLMHAVEALYKREAAAKDPKERPRDRPSWSSCKRFLEDQRSAVHDV